MTKDEIIYDDFAKIELRIGEIKEVLPFRRARNPSYKACVSFGELGEKWSSVQITNYSDEELIGRQVVCVVNMPARNIAGFMSEILILGAPNENGETILLKPSSDVPIAGEIF